MMRRMATALATIACASMVTAADAQSIQRVAFKRGNDNASVSGAITGRQYRDYLIGARAGQRIGVSMTTKGNAYFNILPPEGDVALYNSSRDGNDATSIMLPRTGDYRVRVYLMGAAMRGTRAVPFQLSIAVM